MKKSLLAIALVLPFLSVPQQAQSAELGEYMQDTLMLPVRGAAIISALGVTMPKRAIRGAMTAAKDVAPESSGDTVVFEYAAVPLGFAAGALAGAVAADDNGSTINKAWDKPFSNESFSIEQ